MTSGEILPCTRQRDAVGFGDLPEGMLRDAESYEDDKKERRRGRRLERLGIIFPLMNLSRSLNQGFLPISGWIPNFCDRLL
jgi:hypothetical protein